MATSLNKVITRNADNTINTSTNYSELNVKASNLTNNLVTHLEAQITTMEGAMQAKEGAVDVKIASLASVGTSTYTTPYLDRSLSMMSKAEFNAMAAERRANRAGSGFDEFGRSNSGYQAINEGLWTASSYVNLFSIGTRSDQYIGAIGTSKTQYPISVINGVNNKIDGINDATGTRNQILLPQAPTVLPSTATLTQQQIDSGVIKHADASNSGLIVNGKFDTDTSGWTANQGATLSVVSNRIRILGNGTLYARATQSVSTIIGKKYIVEANVYIGTNTSFSVNASNSADGTAGFAITNVNNSDARVTLEFTATTTTTYISVIIGANTATYIEADNIAVFPADAISRSDLPFIESWHEDISEKDFVYPLGNVQYLGTTGDCGTTVAASFAGAVTYSLFSDTWQADSALVGKGYVWSTLSDANKKAFVANPENNCYLDGDKVIQVRYRARVVQGLGDSWLNTSSIESNSVQYQSLRYANYGTFSLDGSVNPKGKRVSSISKDIGIYTEGMFVDAGNSNTSYNPSGTKSIGIFAAIKSDTIDTTVAYEGKCYALPIALVHRRNTGMMHPVYNPNGTKIASDSLPWYSTTVSFTSIADCFTDSKLLATSGYIGTTTGRADGIFYDQIHEADITDLRMNSRSMNDYQRTSDKWFAKLQDSTYRGTEVEKYTEAKVQTTTGTVATVEVNDGTKYKSGDTIYIYDLTASAVKGRFTVKSISTNTLTVDVAFAKLANNYLISGASSTRTKSNTMTVYDVIGNPANYPADWKTQYASLTSLHTAEDGTSMLPTGTTGSDGIASFKLSRDANATPLQVLKSTDSGATWTALTVTTHYTFSTITNAITFTAGNIPLVADLVRVTYQTHTNMAVPAVNSDVLAIGDASALSYSGSNSLGKDLGQSLIGKIFTNITSVHTDYAILTKKKIMDLKFSTSSSYLVEHNALSLVSAVVPAVKVFHYLTRLNGKAYLQLVFKEMKYGSYAAPTVVTAASATYTINMTYKINIAGCALDGKVIQWTATTATVAVDWSLYDVSPTGVIYLLSSGAVYANARLYDGDSWGDDSKFNIVDNVSTTTDTNGATVLIGQKRVELPYFISASE